MEALAAINWNQFFDGPIVPLTLAFSMITVVAVTRIVANHWGRVRIAEADAMLKARMLERGFSAAEIERVVNAGPQQPVKQARRYDSSQPWKTAESCCG